MRLDRSVVKVHLAPGVSLRYNASAGTEDRATLRSDPSAEPGNGVAGQGHKQVGPAHNKPGEASYTVRNAINR